MQAIRTNRDQRPRREWFLGFLGFLRFQAYTDHQPVLLFWFAFFGLPRQQPAAGALPRGLRHANSR